MPFATDLLLGEEYQNRFLELVDYDSYEMSQGCFKPYDIKITKSLIETKYEVKVDRLAKKTGNIVIEYECSNKPSGITSTEADYWVYFLEGLPNYYLIPTCKIRDAIENKKFTKKTSGGDGWRSKMYIFPMTCFDEFSKLI